MYESIKEKAEEHLRENNITQYEYKSYIEGAVFGANYVLDAIEEATNICFDEELRNVIQQLKK